MEDEQALYPGLFKCELEGRYVHNDHIIPLLDRAKNDVEISEIGTSENGLPVFSVTIGNGPIKVLGWSQMHGNESTTTKVLFDFLQFVCHKKAFQQEIHQFLSSYTFVFIPILNPDGALAYTRVNANEVDLNRDALDQSQKESRILRKVYEEFQPDLNLNLHDQRTIYGTSEGKSATISFLAPAADPERTVTDARKTAMSHIVRMNRRLQSLIPGQVARYDDTYNENCVGDYFVTAGTPSILIEAGHYRVDYQRERTREFIFYALLELFGITKHESEVLTYKDYFDIPENQVNFKDVIIRNIRVDGYDELVSVGIQYKEMLKNGKVFFDPIVEEIGKLDEWYTHNENDGNKGFALLNYHKKEGIGEKIVTIIDKNTENTLFNSTDMC
ncbi:peptidase M14 [Aureitalea sp. L0-47]|nr:peptidase M14 [Aureitalea sp. L0-47]